MRGLSRAAFCCEQVALTVNCDNRAVKDKRVVVGHDLFYLAVYIRFFKELIREVRQRKSLIGILRVGLLLLQSNIFGSYSYRKIGSFISYVFLAVFVDKLMYGAYLNDLIGYLILSLWHFSSSLSKL